MDPAAPREQALLATLGDPLAAELCAARLRAAGIASRLSGEALGPYRLTVGDLARTELWVAAEDLEEARAVLGEEPEPATPAPGDEPGPEEPTGAGWFRRWGPGLVAGALLGLVAWRLYLVLA